MADKRAEAVAAAVADLDGGHFLPLLARLVAVPTESQRQGSAPDLRRYLHEVLGPLYAAAGCEVSVHDNPVRGGGPLLLARRIEAEGLPHVLSYGHGDVVMGMAGRWSEDRDPFLLTPFGDKLFGRGTADNKGQHLINLCALRAVLAARGGRLGFNLTVLIETSEEIGSSGLREFARAKVALLRADVLLASDGPRVVPDVATLMLGGCCVMNWRWSAICAAQRIIRATGAGSSPIRVCCWPMRLPRSAPPMAGSTSRNGARRRCPRRSWRR